VAIVCSQCGKTLPRDDARFCANCGKPVVSLSSSPQSSSVAKSSSAPAGTRPKHSKPVLREQIAQQPPARPTQVVQPEEPSVQANRQREAENKEDQSEGPSQPEKVDQPAETSVVSATDEPEEPPKVMRVRRKPEVSISWPEPMTHVSMTEPPLPGKDVPVTAEQNEDNDRFPIQQLVNQQFEPHELSVKAQEQERAGTLEDTSLAESDGDETPTLQVFPAKFVKKFLAEEEALDELPTRPVIPVTPVNESSVEEDAVDELPTRPTISAAPPELPYSGSTMPVQEKQGTHLPYAGLTTRPVLSARNRKLPIVILLILLVGAGVLTWIVAYQPFSVPTITNPQQSFRDAKLGVSLLYPSGWDKQVDYTKSTVHFYDSSVSRTLQVDIIAAGANPGDLMKYLQQQASSLGMTGAKAGAPLSFAGASWQQLQGTVQQKGANYTCTILASSRGNRLYTIIQFATPDTYADAEHYFFAPMRQSLQFT